MVTRTLKTIKHRVIIENFISAATSKDRTPNALPYAEKKELQSNLIDKRNARCNNQEIDKHSEQELALWDSRPGRWQTGLGRLYGPT